MFSVSVSVAALAAVLVALAALRLLQKQAGGRPSVQRLVRCAVIAAVYVVLCLVLAPFSYGAVQVCASPRPSACCLFLGRNTSWA